MSSISSLSHPFPSVVFFLCLPYSGLRYKLSWFKLSWALVIQPMLRHKFVISLRPFPLFLSLSFFEWALRYQLLLSGPCQLRMPMARRSLPCQASISWHMASAGALQHINKKGSCFEHFRVLNLLVLPLRDLRFWRCCAICFPFSPNRAEYCTL